MGRGPGVRAVGAEAIQIDFRWKGVRCRERLRLRPTTANLKYVARLKATIEHEIATGTFDYAKHFPESTRARRTLGSGGARLRDALRNYVDGLRGQIEPETLREYGQCADQVAAGLGNPFVHEATRARFRQWASSQNLSKQRLDNLLTPVRGYFRQAVEDGVLTTNPLNDFQIRRVSAPKDVIDPFTPAEVTALCKTPIGPLWQWWAWSGPRSGEVIGLQWGDVDAACEHVEFRRAIRRGREKRPKTKAGRRVVRMLPAARAALRSLVRAEDSEPVWRNPETGRGWHEAKALNRAFARACRAAGVRRRYAYQLRHTHATWALSSGENPMWVAKRLGHKDTAVVFKHYAKWIPEMDRNAGSRMVEAAKSKTRRGQRAA